jgi:iron(III) transport system substrate-binding protein
VYTACYLPSDEQLFKSFENSTGIKVNIFYDDSSNLLEKLQQQGAQSEADLLILKGICYLQQARNDNLLQKSSQHAEASYALQFPDAANYWHPLTYDPLIIAYLQDSSMTQPPASYKALAKGEWQGQLLFAANQHFLPSLTATMLADRGEEATLAWLKQSKDNLTPKEETTQIFEQMVADSARVALITASEYITAAKPSNIKTTLPAETDQGVYALVKGVGVVRYAPHPAYAERLLAFLLNTETQRVYAQTHREYPASPEVEPSPSWQALGQFQVNINAISASMQYCDRAKLLLQEAGF